jgi:hypothetical protein
MLPWSFSEEAAAEKYLPQLQHNMWAELKALMLEDAKQAIGHGVRAKRSKSGAISFDLLETEDSRAAL